MNDDKPPQAAAPAGALAAEPLAMAPISLHPQPITRASTMPPRPKEPEQKDSYRELIETVVFVVVLVLMLKTFLAEAFVIPTGSMADTLLGYHHKVTCQQCGYPNLVNASNEAEPQDGGPGVPVERCECQNCGFTNVLARPKRAQGGNP
jgi:predicted nucleic-acid-binding Zn-ribbon protein